MVLQKLVIRHVTDEDIEGIWPIIMGNSDNNKEAFISRVKQKKLLENHYIPVAIFDYEVVGYGWVHDYGQHLRVGHRTARLNDLFVHEEFRNRGIGREIFLSVDQWCKNRNVKWLQWQSSEKATSFYERLGHKGERCPDPDHPFFEIEYETVKEIY
jgi:GNAT superfamily N-acetyltransferase